MDAKEVLALRGGVSETGKGVVVEVGMVDVREVAHANIVGSHHGRMGGGIAGLGRGGGGRPAAVVVGTSTNGGELSPEVIVEENVGIDETVGKAQVARGTKIITGGWQTGHVESMLPLFGHEVGLAVAAYRLRRLNVRRHLRKVRDWGGSRLGLGVKK